MFMLGSFFDTDPQYRTITQALFDHNDAGEMVRADRLYDTLLAYIDTVSGPLHEYERLALNRAVQSQFENVIAFAKRPSSDLVNVLYTIHLRRCKLSGNPPLPHW